MTPQELKALIDSDTQATNLAAVGNDAACAARCSAIAPKLLQSTRLSELGILGLYANPVDGMTVLGTIEAIATQNALFAKVLSFMQPGVAAECLPDFALPAMRAALTLATNLGGLGLSEQLAAPILRAAEIPETITANEVSTAMAPSRSSN